MDLRERGIGMNDGRDGGGPDAGVHGQHDFMDELAGMGAKDRSAQNPAIVGDELGEAAGFHLGERAIDTLKAKRNTLV